MVVAWNSNGASLLAPSARASWSLDPSFALDDDGFSVLWIAPDALVYLVGELTPAPVPDDEEPGA